MEKIELNSYRLEEMEGFFEELGEEKFRAMQLFTFFNKSQRLDIENVNFKKDLLKKIEDSSTLATLEIYKRFDSKVDKTKKYLFLLNDGNIIESVAMTYSHGVSICISTQVGCKMGCSFCASTKSGLIRNLTSGEMLNQIYMIEKDLGLRISNIVLMGSGEPLDNYDEVIRFIDIISHPKGHDLSLRSITLSTSGLVPRIYDLAERDMPITLSISLHSPFNSSRTDIMPVNKAFNLEKLMEACEFYYKKTSRRITLEYTLIEGVNDRLEDAEEIYRISKKFNPHVNLIPLNPIKEFKENRPEKTSVEKFKKLLEKKGLNSTIRREMGGDISASCGQLRRSIIEEDFIE